MVRQRRGEEKSHAFPHISKARRGFAVRSAGKSAPDGFDASAAAVLQLVTLVFFWSRPLDQTTLDQPQARSNRRGYQTGKRMLDVGLCLLAAPFMLLLGGLISLLIYLDSPGPVLFVQKRVGKGGRRFEMYKFRTLAHNVDDTSHKAYMRAFVNGDAGTSGTQESIHKPTWGKQITRVGRILRLTSLDELPQLINVIQGEMSLVGPRPNIPHEVAAYQPWHCQRLEVLPGITGLAQVNGRSCISFDSIVQYDLAYIEAQSVLLDLKILLWTIPAVIAARGVR